MKTALITGASGEIGAAIAREFAAAGYAVAVHGAKNFEKAEKLAEDLRAAGCTAFPICPTPHRPNASGRKATAHSGTLTCS